MPQEGYISYPRTETDEFEEGYDLRVRLETHAVNMHARRNQCGVCESSWVISAFSAGSVRRAISASRMGRSCHSDCKRRNVEPTKVRGKQ